MSAPGIVPASQPAPPLIPGPAVRAVIWHPQRIIGLALIEGLRSQKAIAAGFLAADVDTALGAGLGADVVLVAAHDVPDDEQRDLIEALHHRRRDTPVLAMRSKASVDAVVGDLLRGARGTLCLTDDLAESAAAIRAAMRGLVVIPAGVQAGVVAALSDRARNRRLADDVLARLTEREITVLEFLVDGAKVPQIAAKLGVSTNTVRTYLQRLRAKLDAHSQLQLAAIGRDLLASRDSVSAYRSRAAS